MNGLKKVLKVLNNDKKMKIWVYYNLKKGKFICGTDVKMQRDFILILYKNKQFRIDEKLFMDCADNAMNLYCLQNYGNHMDYNEDVNR